MAPTEHSHGHDHGRAHDHGGHACCGGHHGAADTASDPAIAIDPVCGMKVTIATAKHRLSHQDQDYFFCSGRCRERFAADPAKYLASKQPEPPAPAGTIYT